MLYKFPLINGPEDGAKHRFDFWPRHEHRYEVPKALFVHVYDFDAKRKQGSAFVHVGAMTYAEWDALNKECPSDIR